MKKIIICVILLLLFSAQSFGQDDSLNEAEGFYEWEIVYYTGSSTAIDTTSEEVCSLHLGHKLRILHTNKEIRLSKVRAVEENPENICSIQDEFFIQTEFLSKTPIPAFGGFFIGQIVYYTGGFKSMRIGDWNICSIKFGDKLRILPTNEEDISQDRNMVNVRLLKQNDLQTLCFEDNIFIPIPAEFLSETIPRIEVGGFFTRQTVYYTQSSITDIDGRTYHHHQILEYKFKTLFLNQRNETAEIILLEGEGKGKVFIVPIEFLSDTPPMSDTPPN